LPDHFFGRVPEEPFGGEVPTGDRAFERLADDSVVGGFDDASLDLASVALTSVLARALGRLTQVGYGRNMLSWGGEANIVLRLS